MNSNQTSWCAKYRGIFWGGLILIALATASPAAAAENIFRWQPFLAPFHSVVLHFPIGFVTMAFILELYAMRRPSAELRRAIALVLALCIGSAVVAIALGLMRSNGGDYDAKTIEQHKRYGLAVGGLTILALGAHWLAFRAGAAAALQWVYRGVLAVDIVVLTIAGHQGGNLTHGANYLVKNAPQFVKELVEEEPDSEPVGMGALDEHTKFFVEKVQPLFEGKCLSCHGAEKKKGDLRLDVKESVLKGGKSGKPAIKPGDPLQSNLVRLVLLPPTDEDIMPPAGKGTLTPEEIGNLIHWIQNGAHFLEKTSPAEPEKPVAAELKQ